MYFWWSYKLDNYLFPGFNINSVVAFVSVCFSLAIFGFILEWLKLLQSKLHQRELILRSRQLRTVCPTESANLINDDGGSRAVTLRERILFSLSDFILWLFSFNISYFVMLIIMLFNGWFMVSIISGAAIGYFIFGHSFTKVNCENYKIIRQSYCIYACPEAVPSCSTNGESTPTTSAAYGKQCPSISLNDIGDS